MCVLNFTVEGCVLFLGFGRGISPPARSRPILARPGPYGGKRLRRHGGVFGIAAGAACVFCIVLDKTDIGRGCVVVRLTCAWASSSSFFFWEAI